MGEYIDKMNEALLTFINKKYIAQVGHRYFCRCPKPCALHSLHYREEIAFKEGFCYCHPAGELPKGCYCHEDQGAGYSFHDEHGSCDICLTIL